MAKALMAGTLRDDGSIKGAFGEGASGVGSAQERVVAARADLDRARENGDAVERLAMSVAELVGTFRVVISSVPTDTPAPASAMNIAEDCVACLEGIRTRLEESERDVERLSEQAMRFPRVRAFVDRLLSLLPSTSGPEHPVPVEATCSALDRLASRNRRDLDEVIVLVEDLRRAVSALDRHGSQLASAVESAKVLLAENGEAQLAVRDLAGHAKRYRDDIRLVGSIMSAEAHVNEDIDDAFNEFSGLLSEYREESRLDNFPAEADAYAELMIVQSKMTRVRFAPRLAGKNIVAIAGGFSSGKSSFINSLIGSESRLLPTRITPTTSIPTYVHHVPDTPLAISSFNQAGGKKQLDERTLRAITHDFEGKYGIALKQIVDRVVVSTPELAAWARIAFVDTPGYTNPEGDRIRRRDVDLSLNEMLSAHYLVWVIDGERGTLLERDVEHIKLFLKHRDDLDRIGKTDKGVYIVVNKADKIPRCQQSEILSQVSEVAVKVGIPYAGVGMYSASLGEWFKVTGEPFDAFLNGVNKRVPDLGVKADVQRVLDRYIEFHRREAKLCGDRDGLLTRLDMLVDDEQRGKGCLHKKLTEASEAAELETGRHKTHAEAYSSLRQHFTKSLDRFAMSLENCDAS